MGVTGTVQLLYRCFEGKKLYTERILRLFALWLIVQQVQVRGGCRVRQLNVRTQYDGRDYVSVEEIYYVNEEGDDVAVESATDACIDITICADQGNDLWSWLRDQVEGRLKAAGIKYEHLWFDDEPGPL